MNNQAQNIRAFTAVMAFAFIAGSAPQALATISSPATDQKTLIGTNVFAPVPSVRIDADSTSKEPLIRVAPACPECLEEEG